LSKKKFINIRIDLLDNDGRTLLYNCIKFNYIEIFKIILNYDNDTIGISIIDIKDKLGYTSLQYCVILNNFKAFKILLNNKADPYILSNDGNNTFITCLIYKRNNMLNYLIDNNYFINFLNNNGETLLQIALVYQNNEIIYKLVDKNINLDNTNYDFGLTVLHQSIILDNLEFVKKLLTKNININITDFYGNTALHYIFMEKKLMFLELLLLDNIDFNISNINGDVPLHILFKSNIDISTIDIKILNKIINNTDLNIQNNDGITCLKYIIDLNLLEKFRNILINKPLNINIIDKKLNDDLLEVLIESFYNQLINNKDNLILEWEINCINDVECKNKIKNIIINENRSLPKINTINIINDNNIITTDCYYTGLPIDILCGLLLLYNEFKYNKFNLVVDFPLTKNINLDKINYKYELDFNNIEILWYYQKIIYPSYFELKINKIINNSDYIAIPIGIITSIGAHANILFWYLKKKTIERFEPNGANYPIGFNYNPILLDKLLESKFKYFDSEIIYYAPNKFLPAIGFQILENINLNKCKKLGDPNGFCAVWCIWWIYQRMININNLNIIEHNIANELIKFIKYDNQNFKTLIRNFSKKITDIRDKILSKHNLDINKWINLDYNDDIINKIEKYIISNYLY